MVNLVNGLGKLFGYNSQQSKNGRELNKGFSKFTSSSSKVADLLISGAVVVTCISLGVQGCIKIFAKPDGPALKGKINVRQFNK